MEELRIDWWSVSGHRVLTPAGPIDRVQVDRFRAAVYQAVLTGPVVIIDLSRVTMLGFRGAGAIALAGHVAARTGCRMLLAAPSGAAASTLRRTGAAARLDLTGSVAAALDRVAGNQGTANQGTAHQVTANQGTANQGTGKQVATGRDARLEAIR